VDLVDEGRALVSLEPDGAAVRWTALALPTGGVATVELLLDRLGGVTLQYLSLPAGFEAGLSSGLLTTGRPGEPALAARPASAFRLDPVLLAPVRLPPRQDASGPPPTGCDPFAGTWCEVADGPGNALVFLSEGFDDGQSATRGWSATGAWHEVDFATCPPGATWDPGRSFYFGEDATCLYPPSVTGSLTSPMVGPVTAGAQLSFSLRMDKEDLTFPFPVPIDLCEVWINGVLVASYVSPGDPAAWFTTQPIPLADPPNWDFTGQSVAVEFRFTSDASVNALGWMVDDVVLWDDNGAIAGCSINAGLAGTAPCDQREAAEWDFNEGAFCQGCTYTFYALVECGREMHLPMWDMEGADVQVTDMVTGLPVPLRCRNDTSRADAGLGDYPIVLAGDCCPIPAGDETWWGPPFDETDSAGPGRVAWGFPDCPNLDVYDRAGDGLSCSDLNPPCGGELVRITPGESQVMDCSITEESGLCGIYRLDVTSGGFIWSLFANCDGTDSPQFPIFLDCTEAWSAFDPLPELAVANLVSSPGCPNVTVSFDLQNIGCADQLDPVPIRIQSSCSPSDVQDHVVPGPIPAGGFVSVDFGFTSSCAPVTIEVVVDPDDRVVECTESPTAAACRAAEGIDSLSVETCLCDVTVTQPPQDATTCVGGSVVLDATGISFASCTDPLTYEWSDGAGVVGSDPTLTPSPATTTTYTVVISCPSDPDCTVTETATVTVHRPPDFTIASARDFAPCNLGVDLSWSPAVFHDPSGSGTYNIYRSEVDCADALASPPIVTRLAGTSHFDDTTLQDRTYWYVVEAEDASAPTTCSPQGPGNGGAVTSICLGPVTDSFEPSFPDGVFATLFARHQGDEVTFHWDTARALLPGEHFHLLKTVDDPTAVFNRTNPESDLTRSYTETDVSSPLQFFDLRVANLCEQESLDEFPPG
jgi:hypothetical protein